MFGKLSGRIQELLEEGQAYDKWATAPSTRDLYRRMWDSFTRWCQEHEVEHLPAAPEVVAVYITDLARRLRPSSIGVHLAAIRHYHAENGEVSPTENGIVRRRMAGIRRAKGTAPCQKSPLVLDDLDKAMDRLGAKMKAVRDRALFMVAWAGGLRRSEVVGLDITPTDDGTGFIRFTAQGMDIVLTRSKTDQEREGHVVAIPLRRNPSKCPVRLLQAWLESAEITEGPAFRAVTKGGIISRTRLRAAAVAQAVKKAVGRLGLNIHHFSGHSLRAGFVTTAAGAGAPIASLQATTRHKQIGTLFGYVRQLRRYEESALRYIPSW